MRLLAYGFPAWCDEMSGEVIKYTPEAGGPSGETVCEGVVTNVDHGIVHVAVQANPACATCKSKGHCALAPEGNQELDVQAVGFKPGEHVLVVTSSRAALKTSAVLYLIPTLLIISGSFAGFFAGPAFLGMSGDLGAFVGVIAGIVVSYLFIHFYRVGQAGGVPPVRLVRPGGRRGA
jgi:positive regulator of sigma E activity